jgi:hypothetical protein
MDQNQVQAWSVTWYGKTKWKKTLDICKHRKEVLKTDLLNGRQSANLKSPSTLSVGD